MRGIVAVEKKKVAILSNITVDLIRQKLRRDYDVYIPEGFDTWVQEVLNPSAPLYNSSLDAVIVLLDGMEARSWRDRSQARERLSLWKQALNILEGHMEKLPVFVTTLDLRENRIKAFSERSWRRELENDWYQFVQDLAEKCGHVYVFDLADRIADLGRAQAYSDKMWYMSSMPYSRDGLQLVSEEIRNALGSAFSPRKKIIALDLDNTLWGGVIGEDGVDGIELSDHKEGQRFYDFQRQLLEMQRRGTLLAINSKNNPEDADKAFIEHPAMLIRKENLVLEKVNWNDKASNLKDMEAELNLTEGSFVFIDDNPVEREIVKGECPEVLVPDFPEDTSTLLAFAENLYRSCLRPLHLLKEDVEKTRQYQAEAKRKEEQRGSLNLDDYLSRLEIRADIHRMKPDELSRTAQLCGKTNQFNLTTKRYTEAELLELSQDPLYTIYTVHAADKYGENGLISVVILKQEDEAAEFDTFLMSCRVMGRKLEDVILNEIAADQCGSKKELIGCYIPTAKNKPVSDLYDRLGFELSGTDGGTKYYHLDLRNYQRKEIDAYASIQFES